LQVWTLFSWIVKIMDNVSRQNQSEPNVLATLCPDTKEQIMQEYADVFRHRDKPMKGVKAKIHIDDYAKLLNVRSARKVPLTMRELLADELRELEQNNMIRKVPEDQPTKSGAPQLS
jgi:hypothetical protein